MKTIQCDVRDHIDGATRFNVETSDGRRFEGCAIHGNGGKLRGSQALLWARRRVAGHDGASVRLGLEPRDYIEVYTRSTAHDEERVRLPIAIVTRIEWYRLEGAR